MPMPPALSRQLGPFPVYVWLLIAGAGVGLGVVLRRSGLFADRTLDDPAAEEGAVGSTPGLVPGAGIAAGVPGYGIGYGGAVVLPGGAAPAGDDVDAEEGDTNERWLKRAVAWLAAERGISAVNADTALRKALSGRDVTQAERLIVDAALTRWGTPPEGMPPLDATPDPPVTGPPGDKWYPGLRSHVTSGDQTGGQVAAIYYGSGDGRALGWARIKANTANAWVAGYAYDQKLPNGRTLIIP